MYDEELLIEIFRNISWSIEQIIKRFDVIKTSDDFIKDDTGIEKLDSICMQLINIGEALKQIDKLTDGRFLARYPDIDWKKANTKYEEDNKHYSERFAVNNDKLYITKSQLKPARG